MKAPTLFQTLLAAAILIWLAGLAIRVVSVLFHILLGGLVLIVLGLWLLLRRRKSARPLT